MEINNENIIEDMNNGLRIMSEQVTNAYAVGKMDNEMYKSIIDGLFTQYTEKAKEIKESYKSIFEKQMQHGRELEELRLNYEHDLKEKYITANKEIQIQFNKPKTFMEHLDDISCNLAKVFDNHDEQNS